MLSELISFFLSQQEPLQNKPFPCVFSEIYLPSSAVPILSTPRVIDLHLLNFIPALWSIKYHHPHIQDGETEAQEEYVANPFSVSDSGLPRIWLQKDFTSHEKKKNQTIFHCIYIIETCVHRECFQRMLNDMWGNSTNSPPIPVPSRLGSLPGLFLSHICSLCFLSDVYISAYF